MHAHTRSAIAALIVSGLVWMPGDAWAQADDEGPPPLVTSLTYYGLLKLAVLSTAAGCLAIQAGTSGRSLEKSARMLICVTTATVPGTSTTLVGGEAISDASDARSAQEQREVAGAYLSQEADALSLELALGGGAHLERLAELMESAGGEPLDREGVIRCASRARSSLWENLSGGEDGLGVAADTFAECAEVSR